MSGPSPDWLAQFPMQSSADLDFVIAQDSGLPIGLTRQSPPEFRRRVAAAHVSFWLGLRSVDYALKRYIKPDTYENEQQTLGDVASDFIVSSSKTLKRDLRDLHTQEDLTYGRFGAEITLFKFPEIIDTARMLANRGLLLEVLPILWLAIEMMAWSMAVFNSEDENYVERTNAQSCISKLKSAYATAGEIYGHLSEFSHWKFVVHTNFLQIQEGRAAVMISSSRYRAMSLTLAIIVLDVFVEVIRSLYKRASDELVQNVQSSLARDNTKKAHEVVAQLVAFAGSQDFDVLQLMLR